MSTAAGPELVRVGPRPTPPADVRGALRAVWRSACDGDRDVARAVTVNFVAVAAARDAAAVRDATDRLMRRSPARAFLLFVDEARREPEAEVGAVTRSSGRTCDVLLEEIRIELPPAWFRHVPGLVRPLLIHDLPTCLYWTLYGARELCDDAGGFDAMRRLADHCIVDSGRFSSPAAQLADLAARGGAGAPFTDLTWLRLRPWRRALAEGFERVAWREGLAVEGVVRHGRGGAAAAILLAQWLEQRLDARIALEETADEGELCPQSVAVRFDGCEIRASGGEKCLTVHVTTADRCLLPLRLPRSSGTAGDLLAAAIDIA